MPEAPSELYRAVLRHRGRQAQGNRTHDRPISEPGAHRGTWVRQVDWVARDRQG